MAGSVEISPIVVAATDGLLRKRSLFDEYSKGLLSYSTLSRRFFKSLSCSVHFFARSESVCRSRFRRLHFLTSYMLQLLVAFHIVLTALAAPTALNEKIVASLITAPTEVDRVNLLNDTDFVFDFFNPDPSAVTSSGPDGIIVTARRDTFPALVGNGIAMSLGRLGPCGLNTPHFHPRATEFNIAINGTLYTGMIAENDARLVTNTIQPGQAALFPRGAIHFEQNMGCDPVIFVAAFSDEDPGTSSIANQFFNLPAEIVEATMGDMKPNQLEELQVSIPKNVAFGVQECLQKCGLNGTSKAAISGASRLARGDILIGVIVAILGFWFCL